MIAFPDGPGQPGRSPKPGADVARARPGSGPVAGHRPAGPAPPTQPPPTWRPRRARCRPDDAAPRAPATPGPARRAEQERAHAQQVSQQLQQRSWRSSRSAADPDAERRRQLEEQQREERQGCAVGLDALCGATAACGGRPEHRLRAVPRPGSLHRQAQRDVEAARCRCRTGTWPARAMLSAAIFHARWGAKLRRNERARREAGASHDLILSARRPKAVDPETARSLRTPFRAFEPTRTRASRCSGGRRDLLRRRRSESVRPQGSTTTCRRKAMADGPVAAAARQAGDRPMKATRRRGASSWPSGGPEGRAEDARSVFCRRWGRSTDRRGTVRLPG